MIVKKNKSIKIKKRRVLRDKSRIKRTKKTQKNKRNKKTRKTQKNRRTKNVRRKQKGGSQEPEPESAPEQGRSGPGRGRNNAKIEANIPICIHVGEGGADIMWCKSIEFYFENPELVELGYLESSDIKLFSNLKIRFLGHSILRNESVFIDVMKSRVLRRSSDKKKNRYYASFRPEDKSINGVFGITQEKLDRMVLSSLTKIREGILPNQSDEPIMSGVNPTNCIRVYNALCVYGKVQLDSSGGILTAGRVPGETAGEGAYLGSITLCKIDTIFKGPNPLSYGLDFFNNLFNLKYDYDFDPTTSEDNCTPSGRLSGMELTPANVSGPIDGDRREKSLSALPKIPEYWYLHIIKEEELTDQRKGFTFPDTDVSEEYLAKADERRIWKGDVRNFSNTVGEGIKKAIHVQIDKFLEKNEGIYTRCLDFRRREGGSAGSPSLSSRPREERLGGLARGETPPGRPQISQDLFDALSWMDKYCHSQPPNSKKIGAGEYGITFRSSTTSDTGGAEQARFWGPVREGAGGIKEYVIKVPACGQKFNDYEKILYDTTNTVLGALSFLEKRNADILKEFRISTILNENETPGEGDPHKILITPIYMVIFDDMLPVLIMPKGGNSLEAELRPETAVGMGFNLNEILTIGTDIMEGIKMMHWGNPCPPNPSLPSVATNRIPIIHRDLKSPNLLITYEGSGYKMRPRGQIIDFGLTRECEMGNCINEYASGPIECGDLSMTRCGSILWMAPEILLAHNYDQKVDIYSWAMVMYELITSGMPWRDTPGVLGLQTVPNLVANLGMRPDWGVKLGASFVADVEVDPRCAKALLKNLIEDCWAQLPADRPEASEVIEELVIVKEKFAEEPGGAPGLPRSGSSSPPPSPPPSPRHLHNDRWHVIVDKLPTSRKVEFMNQRTHIEYTEVRPLQESLREILVLDLQSKMLNKFKGGLTSLLTTVTTPTPGKYRINKHAVLFYQSLSLAPGRPRPTEGIFPHTKDETPQGLCNQILDTMEEDTPSVLIGAVGVTGPGTLDPVLWASDDIMDPLLKVIVEQVTFKLHKEVKNWYVSGKTLWMGDIYFKNGQIIGVYRGSDQTYDKVIYDNESLKRIITEHLMTEGSLLLEENTIVDITDVATLRQNTDNSGMEIYMGFGVSGGSSGWIYLGTNESDSNNCCTKVGDAGHQDLGQAGVPSNTVLLI